MYGNITRESFRPPLHFTGVRLLQGVPVTDADGNEAAEIAAYRLRTTAADLIGPHGGPAGRCAFRVLTEGELTDDHRKRLKRLGIATPLRGDFVLGAGHYYVDGLLCENEDIVTYLSQPGLRGQSRIADGTYLAYLHVFEREVGRIERPDIHEVALGHVETSHRHELVWQVKLAPADAGDDTESWALGHLAALTRRVRPLLKAGVHAEQTEDDPCAIAPESRYRGLENQLYRVEVHRGGGAGEATFKWSRDNGSVQFAIRDAASMTLEDLGRDDRLSLYPGDIVELVDDNVELADRREPIGGPVHDLLRVEQIDRDTNRVVLSGTVTRTVERAFLRRWDRDPTEAGLTDAPAPIEEDQPILLERGVEIRFVGGESTYAQGDYWTIPARVATGDVMWPGPPEDPAALEPQGPQRHYAPLARLTFGGGELQAAPVDFRRTFEPVATWPPAS